MVEIDEFWYQRHDIFNLITLPLVILANGLYLFQNSSWYWVQFWAFFLYVVVDTAWLILKPRSVPSPQMIIIHHVVCIIGWILPAVYNQIYADWISYGLLVEVNTWFLIARRTWKTVTLLNICFYLCWFVLRLIMYPVTLYRFSVYIVQESFDVHYTAFIQWTFMVALTALNFKWTFDMIAKLVKDRSNGKSEIKKGL